MSLVAASSRWKFGFVDLRISVSETYSLITYLLITFRASKYCNQMLKVCEL